jgi:hypothetical protein
MFKPSRPLARYLWLALLVSPVGAPLWSWATSVALMGSICRGIPVDVLTTHMACQPSWLDPAANYIMTVMTVWMLSFALIVPGVAWTLLSVWVLRRFIASLIRSRVAGA